MKLTLRTYYAVLALVSMVEESSGRDRWRRIEEIARGHGISESFLLQVFQDLKKSGLVDSKRGANGGYALSRSAETISLADIIESVEGPILPCPVEERNDGDRLPSWRALDLVWGELRERIREEACGLTLDRIAEKIGSEGTDMYYI